MTGRHVSAHPGAARRRRQGPKPRTSHARAARSAAALTLAEHSSTLNDVMAGRASTADPHVERQGDRRQTGDKMFGAIACKVSRFSPFEMECCTKYLPPGTRPVGHGVRAIRDAVNTSARIARVHAVLGDGRVTHQQNMTRQASKPWRERPPRSAAKPDFSRCLGVAHATAA